MSLDHAYIDLKEAWSTISSRKGFVVDGERIWIATNPRSGKRYVFQCEVNPADRRFRVIGRLVGSDEKAARVVAHGALGGGVA